MRFDLDDLPSEPALLQHLIRDMAAAVEHRDGEIERLKSIIKKLQRAQFGRRSERLDPDQLALALEEIDSDLAREEEKGPHGEKQKTERSSRRKPLPDHLSREEVRLDIESMICSCCGGALHVIGESVSEMLDWVPAELRVIRTTRPKYACRTCETVTQAPAAERPIAGGLATPALLAQVSEPVPFDIQQMDVTAGPEVAFAVATMGCAGPGPDGKPEPLDFRLTMCLKKIDGRWMIVHEHHSVPAID